ncbi:MAG: hypothetical protein ACXAEU_05470 [Candidatus Hodarchaeales archaeon]|jgi:hypothetical protein
MQAITAEQEHYPEKLLNKPVYPSDYRYDQYLVANTDLLKSLLTKPRRAMGFPVWTFLTLFFMTLSFFSIVHALLLLLTGNFAGQEIVAIIMVFTRIFSSSVVALAIAMPGVVFLWVITPEITFTATFKRLMLYYEAVLFFSLLGELFFCKFIIESMMKVQPFIVLAAGSFAVTVLHRALTDEPRIQITRSFIIGILTISYTQAFLIIDDLLPYHAQDNINSPLTIFLRMLFTMLFG